MASGGRASVRSSSSCNSSRSVFRYCATVSRRTSPFLGAGRKRATSRDCVIQAAMLSRSAAVGCGWPFGGMEPSLMRCRMPSQTRMRRSSNAASNWSTLTPAMDVSSLWQRTQFFCRNGFTCCSNAAGAGTGAAGGGTGAAGGPPAAQAIHTTPKTDSTVSTPRAGRRNQRFLNILTGYANTMFCVCSPAPPRRRAHRPTDSPPALRRP